MQSVKVMWIFFDVMRAIWKRTKIITLKKKTSGKRNHTHLKDNDALTSSGSIILCEFLLGFTWVKQNEDLLQGVAKTENGEQGREVEKWEQNLTLTLALSENL